MADVEVSTVARLGRLHLNRPRALNALDAGMVQLIANALESWEHDDRIAAVLVTGEGERGLCAGGDIVSLYRAAVGGDPEAAARFWADEYRLNARIARYRKPYVALMHGIVLGGGVGISAHGSHRIVTDSSRVGMPETGIGFVPDVGGTWLLAHAPGELGTLAALSAQPVGPGDAIAMGLADAYVPSARIRGLIEALEAITGVEDVAAAVAAHAETPPTAELAASRSWIDAALAHEEVADILVALRARPEQAARAAADTIAAKSPTAVAATLESLRRSRALPSLEAALDQEFAVSLAALAAPDFAEGVRAQVVDKDRDPHWSPAHDVARADIRHWFDGPGLGLAAARTTAASTD